MSDEPIQRTINGQPGAPKGILPETAQLQPLLAEMYPAEPGKRYLLGRGRTPREQFERDIYRAIIAVEEKAARLERLAERARASRWHVKEATHGAHAAALRRAAKAMRGLFWRPGLPTGNC